MYYFAPMVIYMYLNHKLELLKHPQRNLHWQRTVTVPVCLGISVESQCTIMCVVYKKLVEIQYRKYHNLQYFILKIAHFRICIQVNLFQFVYTQCRLLCINEYGVLYRYIVLNPLLTYKQYTHFSSKTYKEYPFNNNNEV